MNGQTSIIGSNSVDIRTEKNTHVEGAVIAAENGNPKLDTGTLTYKDLQDKGDLLATLQGLASDQGMRALASAMLTASLTQGASNLAGLDKAAKAADASALRFRTLLAFREAGILNGNGRLTAKGISSATEIPLKGGQITNSAIVEALTQDGSSITVWGKFKTSSVAMPNGQSLQIHFYKNKLTGAIDNLTADFKVKGIVKP